MGGKKCIDIYAGDTTDNKPLEIWDCIVSTTGRARNESMPVNMSGGGDGEKD
jgi:hypothetical protein